MQMLARIGIFGLCLAAWFPMPSHAQSSRFPGTSHADALLQHDTLFYVGINVGLHEKGCPQFRVVTTAFAGYDGSGAVRRPWHEIWTVAACGHTWEVPVTYVPDATGTTITVPASSARPRQ